jgi:hypothetical protein
MDRESFVKMLDEDSWLAGEQGCTNAPSQTRYAAFLLKTTSSSGRLPPAKCHRYVGVGVGVGGGSGVIFA